ncbi:MAG: MarR family transcriptional regulator [Rikenellaceae bacterium]|nr:MarR family transcriptional regulator [Rikenellaceae bacterium]
MERLCAIRDIYRAIYSYEESFHDQYGMCLNEGMLLCSLKDGQLSSGEIAEKLSLSCSNTSKLIRAVEEKGFITRTLGKIDKRQMYFTLTKEGKSTLEIILKDEIDLPEPLHSYVQTQIQNSQ